MKELEPLLEEEIEFLNNKDNLSLSDVGYVIVSLTIKAATTKEVLYHAKVLEKGDFDSEGFIYSLWLTLDEKFKIVDKLCDIINFSKIFGAWGAPLDLVKKKAIRALIRYIIIPMICGLFKMKELEKKEIPKTKKVKK